MDMNWDHEPGSAGIPAGDRWFSLQARRQDASAPRESVHGEMVKSDKSQEDSENTPPAARFTFFPGFHRGMRDGVLTMN